MVTASTVRSPGPAPDGDASAWLADREALGRLGLRAWIDLLGQRGVVDARRLAEDPPPGDAALRSMLAPGAAVADLSQLPLERLARLPAALRRALQRDWGVETVHDLARMARLVQHATTLPDAGPDPFDEAPSAPRELIPRAAGAVTASVRYPQFVRERPFPLADVDLSIAVDPAKVQTLDERLLAAFQFDLAPTLHLGYMAAWRQRWVSVGTHLGEPLQSIGLAPGETRRIAVVDWQRRVRSQRTEDTQIAEELDNQIVHTRAVHEITRATAAELQQGGTGIEAGAAAAGAAGVLGMAYVGAAGGAVSGAAIGALVGGVGAVPGALIGLGVGAVAGAIGGAAMVGGAAQIGTVRSESSGERTIVSDMSQRINDVSTQHATAMRAVMSTVVLSASEAERERVSTRAIANHNHAHALTLQYFEVLQHYELHTALDEHQALLFLPFKPVVFDAEMVDAYWEVLRHGFELPRRRRYDTMLQQARRLERSPLLAPELDLAALRVTRLELRTQQALDRVRISVRSPQAALRERFIRADFEPGQARTLIMPPDGAPIDDVDGLLLTRQTVRQSGSVFGGFFGGTTSVVDEPVSAEFEVEVHFDHTPPITLALRDSSGSDGRMDWSLRSLLAAERAELRALADAADDLTEVVHAVNARRYLFTRLLLLALEPEQMRELIEALLITRPVRTLPGPFVPPPLGRNRLDGSALRRSLLGRFHQVLRGDSLPLSTLVDPQPFALCDGMLVLRQRTLRPQGATATAHARIVSRGFADLAPLRDYPLELAAELEALAADSGTEQVFVPTGGHFLEAVLGRSNSAERLDGRRHIFWHEMPNPLLATEIASVALGSRAQPLPDTNPSDPAPTVTPAAPTPLPDPTLGALALQALGRSDLFRDMSKAAELTTVLGNLSNLAGNLASQAGQLAGNAQREALSQAGALGQQVAGLAAQLFAQQEGGALGSGAASTQRAVAGNRIEDLARNTVRPIPPTDANRAVASAFGAPLGQASGREGPAPQGADFVEILEEGGRADPEAAAAREIRNALPETLRAPTDAGVALDDAVSRAEAGTTAEDLRRRVAQAVDIELRPLIAAAAGSDEAFDRALRTTLDLDATLQQLGDTGLPTLQAFAVPLADAWLASRDRAVAAVAAGDLARLARIEDLLVVAQTLPDLAEALPARAADVDAILAAAGVAVAITRFDTDPAVVAGGAALDVTVEATLTLGGGAPAPLQGARVVLNAPETEQEEVAGTTDAAGRCTMRVVHRLPPPGFEGVSLRFGSTELPLAVSVIARESVLLSASQGRVVPGQLTVQVVSARFDDGRDALAGAVVMAPGGNAVSIRFAMRSAGVPLRDAPVQFVLTGLGTLGERTQRTGRGGDEAGIASVRYEPPGVPGVAFIAVTAESPDGRLFTGRADIDHN